MTIGCSQVTADSLPLMSEADARTTLQSGRLIYGVPTEWDGETDSVAVFTADPIEAAYCADVICRQDQWRPYRAYAGGGVDVVGPIEVVLVGIAGTEFIDWRPAEKVFPLPPVAGDRDEQDRRYSLLMCLVRPARMAAVERYAELVTGEVR